MRIWKLTVYRSWSVVRTNPAERPVVWTRLTRTGAFQVRKILEDDGLWNSACYMSWRWRVMWGGRVIIYGHPHVRSYAHRKVAPWTSTV